MAESYAEVRKRVDSLDYVPLCEEGAPIHPAGWSVADGIDYNAWYERHINAYIKHRYGVAPDD